MQSWSRGGQDRQDTTVDRTRVALFCGGRGSAGIAAEISRLPNTHLSVIINGFDDGLSTGTLRRLIPGMLGPSDFRKMFASLLDGSAPRQQALKTLLEFRLAGDIADALAAGLRAFARSGRYRSLPRDLAKSFLRLDTARRTSLRAFLAGWFDYADKRALQTDYNDFSLGNLIFAGVHLRNQDFNAAISTMADICHVPADIVDVSAGECRWLAALKEDGTLLASESDIVAPQSASPIAGLYLLGRPIDAAEWRLVADRPLPQKHLWLSAREAPAALSREAATAIDGANLIVFGPGTQHSSLLPSYRIAGQALRASKASHKVLVLNLDPDHDIQGLGATDLVDRALQALGDPLNRDGVVTHVLYDLSATLSGDPDLQGLMRHCAGYGIDVIASRYRDPARPRTHCGRAVVDHLLALTGSGARTYVCAERPSGTSLPLPGAFPTLTPAHGHG